MTVAREMIEQGLGHQKAHSILGRVSAAQTSAGTNQATATALVAPHVILATVGSGEGVVLPTSPSPGDEYSVANGGLNSLFVYPQSGAKLNNQTADLPLTLPTGKGAWFKCINSTNWLVVYS